MGVSCEKSRFYAKNHIFQILGGAYNNASWIPNLSSIIHKYEIPPLFLYSVFTWVIVFNTTFNNISVISWWSVLLVEETGVTGENYRTVASHWQTWSHNVVLSSTPRHEREVSNSWIRIFKYTNLLWSVWRGRRVSLVWRWWCLNCTRWGFNVTKWLDQRERKQSSHEITHNPYI